MAHSGDRFARQRHAFPDSRREETSIVVVNAAAAPTFTRMLLAGATAMGVPEIVVDGYSAADHPHYLRGAFRRVVETIAPETEYRLACRGDYGMRAGNGWLVNISRNPGDYLRLQRVREFARTGARMLFVSVSDTAVSVEMASGHGGTIPACLRMPAAAKATAPMELNILAAGLCLDAIIRGTRAVGESDYSGHYNVCLPRRICPGGSAGSRDNAAPAGTGGPAGAPMVFRGRHLIMVGAGALGNWAAIPLALEGAHLTIYDGDQEVAPHNLNRQILLVNGVGCGRPKVDVLAEELRLMQPLAQVEAHARYITREADLDLDGAEALICVPDNDDARLLCADAARQRGLLYATAGSSATGCQITVVAPDRACYRCVTGHAGAPAQPARRASCALEENDAIVSTNMVAAGLLISELRQALAGRRSVNLRFVPTAGRGNRLDRAITNPPCPHRPGADAAQAGRTAGGPVPMEAQR